MQTFSEFFAKKLEENQAPAQQPPKPGAPATAQQPPRPGAPVPAQQPPKPGAPVPAQQPPKPGAPVPAQQPPKISQQQKTALLGTVNKAVTGVVDNALKQLKLI